jgi:hypothetical protein
MRTDVEREAEAAPEALDEPPIVFIRTDSGDTFLWVDDDIAPPSGTRLPGICTIVSNDELEAILNAELADAWPQDLPAEDPLDEGERQLGDPKRVGLVLSHYLRATGWLTGYRRNHSFQAKLEELHPWLPVALERHKFELLLEIAEKCQRVGHAAAASSGDTSWVRFNTPVRRAIDRSRWLRAMRRRLGAAPRPRTSFRPRARRVGTRRARARSPGGDDPDSDPSSTRECMFDLDARCRPTEPKQAQPPLARALPRWSTRRRSRRRRSVPR